MYGGPCVAWPGLGGMRVVVQRRPGVVVQRRPGVVVPAAAGRSARTSGYRENLSKSFPPTELHTPR